MIGKIIGGLFGFLALGPLGLLLGLFVGHMFDRGLNGLGQGLGPEQRAELEARFINTLFPLLGKLAKADGRVSEAEIAHAEQLMAHYGLSAEHRRSAIQLFQLGAEPFYDPAPLLRDFQAATSLVPDLRRVLLSYLIGLAMADGELHAAEVTLLRQVAQALGFGGAAFEQLLAMLRAQDQFRGQQAPAAGQELATAYAALGVAESAGDAEVKKAYRRLMSENHPDKLIGQGVPEDMIRLATERAQEVQRAYDTVRKARK